MATTLTATLVSRLYGTYAGAPDVGQASQSFSDSPSYAFTDGTGANQAQKYWADTRTINASSSENLDLSGGITDIFGTTLTLTKVKLIRIRAAAANTNNVLVGGAASNAFVGPFADATDIITIKPGGCFTIVDPTAAGYTVTAGTGDILKVANSGAGTSVDYTIEIVGV